jgi:hypothetical protein
MGLLVGVNDFEEFHLPAGLDFAGGAYASPSQLWLPLQHDEGIALFTTDPVLRTFTTETGPYSFTVAGACF